MAKIAQNLIILIQPTKDAPDISFKAGSMSMNRSSIDEDAAFEFSGVYNLNSPSIYLKEDGLTMMSRDEITAEQGMGFISSQSTISVKLRMN